MKAITCITMILSAAMFAGCTNLFLFPDSRLYSTPASLGLKFEEFWIDDGRGPRLNGWRVPSTDARRRGAILHLHGNAQNISAHFGAVHWLVHHGYDLFLVDYRGYGISDGDPSVEGANSDVARAISYVFSKTERPIIVFGQSIGAAMALYNASKAENSPKISCLIAESPFSSYRTLAREKIGQLWFLHPVRSPLALLFKKEFDPITAAGRITAIPTLLVHSTSDEVIPFHHSEELFETLQTEKQFLRVERAAHIRIFDEEGNRGQLLAFLSARCG